MEKVAVRPVRIRGHSAELRTDTMRGVGFTARCSCGWRSPTRRTFRAARADGREHADEHKPVSP